MENLGHKKRTTGRYRRKVSLRHIGGRTGQEEVTIMALVKLTTDLKKEKKNVSWGHIFLTSCVTVNQLKMGFKGARSKNQLLAMTEPEPAKQFAITVLGKAANFSWL